MGIAVEKDRARRGPDAAARPVAIFSAVFAAAAIFYSFHLGRDPLGASEAYSAYAAARPSVGAIVRIPIADDPGKQLLYYIVLHFWTKIFGAREAGLRAMSVVFGLCTLAMIFALGRDLFDDAAGAGAAAMWAFNPMATVFSFRARMYTMLIAFALAHVYAFRRSRDRGGALWTIACALTGAAVIYTHLGGVAILAAEVAILVRDFIHGRRRIAPWLALAGAVLLFAPYLPIALAQSRVLIAGHWLDWIGPAYHYSIATKLLVTLGAAALTLWLVFGGALEPGDEPFRFCLLWIAIPILLFSAGSIAVRPMFQVRYVSPALAMLPVLAAGLLAIAGSWVRNAIVVAVTALMLATALSIRLVNQPWGAAARMVAEADRPEQPIFFESGFVTTGEAPKVANAGFPHGYYSLPFDYYFNGANPRLTIAPEDPAAARAEIQNAAERTGGAWLVTWMDDAGAHAELPDPARFTSTLRLRGERMMLFRIVPANAPPG
ncbi:MAG TPA: glycosyltransferase family 39 protein [Candidatus Binataceae bacterium]|nr:glycosyltransferase family 39 protein [Candidatus Binataceae bacterium]